MKFTELDLSEKLLLGIKELGFDDTTDVQEKTFLQTFEGKDVLVQSQTGTGKTAAFVVSLLKLFEDGKIKNSQALIVSPTRELAIQIEKEAKMISKHLDYKIGVFYGGVGYAKQLELLKNGVNIMIGTPGRILDLTEKGAMKLGEVHSLVVDEADRLLDMGFLQDLQRIFRYLKPAKERITMLFSATLSFSVKNIAISYMNNPVEIEIASETITVEKINQQLFHIGKKEKIRLLLGILKNKKPKSVIVFTNTKQAAFEIASRLKKNDYQCDYLIGDLPQTKRQRIIESFKMGKIPILIATDVAARGLHVDDLELVVNYDIPMEPESYVHRIGRTARIGHSGEAISFACEEYVYGLEPIEQFIKMKIPVEWPDEENFVNDLSFGERFFLDKRGDRNRNNSSGNNKRNVQQKGRRKTPVRKTNSTNNSYNKNNSQLKKPNHINLNRSQNIKANPKHKNFNNSKPNIKLKKNASIQDRINFYNEKYGDDFQVSPELLLKEKKSAGFLNKIRKRFQRKK